MLTVISVVSLIVGGIGIMNIMLVAVTERTREIGVRKAIGAKRSSILTQFLVEALMLSLVGGAIGLGISAIGCWIIGNLMGIAIVMPFWVIAMSLGFCTAIGLIFGMFPAIKAARMQPIDALRRE
jgi:putative ABC transport system permease protein